MALDGWTRHSGRLAVALAMAPLACAACGVSQSSSAGSGSGVQVVAAENFWGSIASQIGGAHARVTSIIVNPATDPHDYEAKPGDARMVAQAGYVIANGAGYDPWVPKLLAANPASGRTVLTVADLFGKHEGDNPHLWYSPSYVDQVVDHIASDMGNIDPGDKTYFQQQGAQYKAGGLMAYHDTINTIKQKYTGAKVGATESMFAYMADGLNLNLVTPYSYLKAISEGTEPSAADKAAVQNEIATKAIKVLIFNSQNTTPDVRSLVAMAHAQGIPVVQITETLTPANATFQAWQTAQLTSLLQALGG